MKKKTIEKIPLRVLYLEDSPRDVEIIRESLLGAGFDLKMDCTDAEKEFVSFLHRGTYDIILSDFKLPGFDAFGALQKAVEICPSIPFICVSGTIGEETAVDLLKQRAVDYVLKDRLTRLPFAIKRALDEAKEKEIRMQVEEALKKSQLFLKSSIESPKDMIILSIDEHYQYLYFNTYHKDVMVGAYGKDIKLGMNLLECITNDDDRRKAKINYDRALMGENHITIEEYGDLDRYYYETRYSPIVNDKNKIIGATAFSVNVTERKRAEEALQESEEKFSMAFQTSPYAITITRTEDGVFIEVNDAFTLIAGYTREEALADSSIGLKLWANEEDREIVVTDLRAGRAVKGREYQFRTKSGKNITGLFSAQIIKLSSGPCILSSINNITDRKQAEEKLKKSEEKYRSIFENVQDVYYETMFDGTILEVSPSIEFISKGQYCRTDLIGRSMFEFYYDINERHALIAKLQKAGDVTDFEVRLKNKDGSLIHCSISSKIISSSEGQPNKIIGSMHNITDRKQAEEKLKKSEERYRSLYDDSKDAIMILTPDLGFIAGNPTAIKMFACKDELDFTSRSPASLSPEFQPDGSLSTDKAQHMMRLALENGSHFFEWMHQRADRTNFPATVLVSKFESGDTQLLQATVRDITESKHAEEKINNQMEELQRWYDVMLDRADRTQELKREVNELCRRAGETIRYPSQESDHADSKTEESK